MIKKDILRNMVNSKIVDPSTINRVVYNDQMGYAIVYYHPNTRVNIPESQNICDKRRNQCLEKSDDMIDAETRKEIEAMVRRKERENTAKDIKDTCERVRDLFHRCEKFDMNHREILNCRVREQIKGKSADQICDILVKDVLQNVKNVYQKDERDVFPHKIKAKILAAGVRRCPSPTRIVEVKKEEKPKVCEPPKCMKCYCENVDQVVSKVSKILDQPLDSEVFHRKYAMLLDNIREEIIQLKTLCTKKIYLPL